MSVKSVLLLTIVVVLISGCAFNGKGPEGDSGIEPDFIPTSALPPGFVHLGTHGAEVDMGSSMMDATESVYRYNDKEDVYIQVIENNDPETLITLYKQRYKNANYDPFEEISLNGHTATKITDYYTVNGKQKPHYSVMWATEEYMILVGSSEFTEAVMDLAKATGR